MNLDPSELQNGIAEAAANFLKRTAASDHGGRVPEADTAVEPNESVWRQCAELGWLGVTVPEHSGGLGLGLPEELMLFRQIGRYLAPGPFLSSALAARAAVTAGEGELAQLICSGGQRVGMVVGSTGIDVTDGGLAITFGSGSVRLVAVRVTRVRPAVDPAVRLAEVEITNDVLQVDDGSLLSRARVLLAAQCVGIIEAVRDASAEYARVRTQFGRPIGSFQAVKHRCADMVIAMASTVGQVHQAALYVESGHPDAGFHAAAAYLLAAQQARRCASDNVLNHGATGFTWEHDAHLYVKRVLVLENVLGPLSNVDSDVLEPARHEFR